MDEELARLISSAATDAGKTPDEIKARLLQVIDSMGAMLSDDEKQDMKALLHGTQSTPDD